MKDKFLYRTLIFLSYSLTSFIAEAQDKFQSGDKMNELTVDRPGIAEAPYTVAPGMYQLETGFDYYKRTNGKIYFLPVTLFRTGISKSAEVRVSVRNIHDKTNALSAKGISPLTVGIKTHIIEQRGWIPETDILADFLFPLGNSSFQPSQVGHDVFLLFENDITSKFAINYNVGLIWDGSSNRNLFTASVCSNFLVTDRLGLFIEYYDFIRKLESKEHGIDGGITYLIAPHIQVDFSAGISLVDSKLNHFVSSGFSIRID